MGNIIDSLGLQFKKMKTLGDLIKKTFVGLELFSEPLHKVANIYSRIELDLLRTHTCNFLKLI